MTDIEKQIEQIEIALEKAIDDEGFGYRPYPSAAELRHALQELIAERDRTNERRKN